MNRLRQGILPILLSCDSELLEFKEIFTSVGRVCVIVGKNRQGPEGEWKSVESKKSSREDSEGQDDRLAVRPKGKQELTIIQLLGYGAGCF